MALAPLPRARDSSASTSASAPFSGLCICVSGLSKEARTQVMEATQRLGGTYSPNLHPKCTHLLVQSLQGHKLDHAFNYRLFVVTLGWFIDSVNKNVKLSELPYTVWSVAPVSVQMEDRLLNPPAADESCIQIGLKHKENQSEECGGQKQCHSGGKFEVNKESQLFGQSIYIDFDVSAELHSKVVDVAAREGAVLVDQWFVGCGASYVVCEGSSTQRYLGHSDNIVSPIWVLKTFKERSMQRFVRFSADLARHVGVMLENLQHVTSGQEAWEENCHEHVPVCNRSKVNQKERLQAANLAKCGIRNRRVRRLQQSCQAPLRPINPSSLLDNICWSVSEPTSSAAVYADSLMSKNDFEIHKHGLSVGVGGDCIEPEAAFSNSLRRLTESEKNQLVFKNHFLTILYPVDRFSELGPSSRTYFSDPGFTCLQVLEFIHAFYQENMSEREIEFAIHTDSRHAEKLRSIYCSERTEQIGYVVYKRIEFLGSRKSFEMLKRISGDNNSNVYELLLRE
ncbi:uncharacterized protein LOC104906031 isoform X1 [Beta vulgaris subsp. vulgaris]|uniref:uncharacterized protein LOC104906031 isoform X1 n=1 Tax=Beta vulgaris subsp. vulgaris TaxID=3555 RepID=UPI002036B75F|nr:uncharacterized protein LOC104906031 isoform X1 [Beta vulgaris subsp. vulgaris]